MNVLQVNPQHRRKQLLGESSVYVAIQLSDMGIARIARNRPPNPKLEFPLTVQMPCGAQHVFKQPKDIPVIPVMCSGHPFLSPERYHNEWLVRPDEWDARQAKTSHQVCTT